MRPCLVVWSILALMPGAARATECRPSRLQLVVDRSTSMTEELVGTGQTKWSVAADAIRLVIGDYHEQVQLGLTLFPQAQDSCALGGELVVSPKATGRGELVASFLDGGALPERGFTPLGEVLGEVPTYDYFGRPGDDDEEGLERWRRYLLLLTDGREDCPWGEGEMSHDDIVARVQTLRGLGIETFVVGFGRSSSGDGVDAGLLGAMAVAGGSARPGCDPTATDPGSPRVCYYQADDEGALLGALEEILVEVSQEVCDGEDNDCDGAVDEDCGCGEGTTQPCGSDIGECRAGLQRCIGGQWSELCENALPPSAEICDGLDNDCDGLVDEPTRRGDDDAAQNLCRADEICQDGRCMKVPPPADPPPHEVYGSPAGCSITGSSPCALALVCVVLSTLRGRGRGRGRGRKPIVSSLRVPHFPPPWLSTAPPSPPPTTASVRTSASPRSSTSTPPTSTSPPRA